MNYLSIDGCRIPKGNYAFIYDVTKNDALFSCFFEAEKVLKLKCKDFARNIRLAYETFALEEYAADEHEKQKQKGCNDSIDEIKRRVLNEIRSTSSVVNYKTLIIDLCRDRALDFSEMLYSNSLLNNQNTDEETTRRVLGRYIRSVYAFGSESSHVGINNPVTYNECLKLAGSFHDFLRAYYRLPRKKFDIKLAPIDDYIPVPKDVSDKMGMRFDAGKTLYIKEVGTGLRYFVFSQETKQISKGRRRDIDVIEKLWEINFDDPSNVIRQVGRISGSDEQFNYRIYSLPGMPLRLTLSLVNSISPEDKLGIIKGICYGLASIHDYDPPLYHRNICPDAFYLFQIKGKYKALLAKFDYAKDTDPNADFTLLSNVENNAKDQKANLFYAPEVINSNVGVEIDWEKADIYSLAMTCLFLLVGDVISVSDHEQVIESLLINDNLKIVLMEMLSADPKDRPDISTVISCLS